MQVATDIKTKYNSVCPPSPVGVAIFFSAAFAAQKYNQKLLELTIKSIHQNNNPQRPVFHLAHVPGPSGLLLVKGVAAGSACCLCKRASAAAGPESSFSRAPPPPCESWHL